MVAVARGVPFEPVSTGASNGTQGSRRRAKQTAYGHGFRVVAYDRTRPVRINHEDPDARYFGGRVEARSLVPLGEARLGRIGFDEWLRRAKARA
jgi:hypothetical protein